MKKILLTVAMGLLASDAFAICEGVDKKALLDKLEKVVAEGEMGKEVDRFNKDIVGNDRLCTVKLYQESKKGAKLDKLDSDIVLTYEIIKGE